MTRRLRAQSQAAADPSPPAQQPPSRAEDRSQPRASLTLDERGVRLYHADWRELAEVARAEGGVDSLIVDAPYSERTHSGHDSAEAYDESGAPRDNKVRYGLGLEPIRRGIDYAAWSDCDVVEFVRSWAPLVRGWFVTVTDHALARAWETALSGAERYVFAPLPFYSPGSRVRLSGDGPSAWTNWIVVARPSSREFTTWGTLPGGYSGSPERAMPIVGGKPLWLMRALVRDYTRPGDLVCDPCAGAGTLGVACIAEGRRALLGDRDEGHVRIAAERLRALPAEEKRGTLALRWGT